MVVSTKEAGMGQIDARRAGGFNRDDAPRIDWIAVSRAGSTLLDRLLDLLAIFRRPVPAPVRIRRR
jgi:hypothetical protein